MAELIVRLLGGFEAHLQSGATLALSTRKTEALLAYLALPAGRRHPRDTLTALLWGDRADRQARQSLRQALSDLRRALALSGRAATVLVEEGEIIGLARGAVDVDAVAFERLARSKAVSDLTASVDLYLGDLLAGLVVKASGFEEWLMAERARLHELAVEAHARLVSALGEAGEVERAIQAAVRLLALDPLQEPAHRALMRLYVRAGRRDAALRQYQVCLDVMQRELGVEPERQTRQIYQELVGQRGASTRPRAPSLPAPAPGPRLIGRDAELERLRSVVDGAWRGQPLVAAVLGEAGAGKTRLIEELGAVARSSGGRVVAGRAYEMERHLPFGSWVEILRSALNRAVEEPAVTLEPAAQSLLALLLPELGAAPVVAPAVPDHSLALFEAVTSLIARLAADHPLVIALDDLHWADDMTLRLLAFVARRLGAAPVLIVASAREEELAGAPVLEGLLRELDVEQRLVRIPLGRLTRDATRALVRALGRSGRVRPGQSRTAEHVWRQSEGNPFMVVELMRALDEAGRARAAAALSLPERVRQVIAGRIERLSERGRELLSVAAVLGGDFGFPLLQRAIGLDDRTVVEGIEELMRRRILDHRGDVLQFDHDRIRDVAYESLSPARRQVLHAAAGAALEAIHGPQLEEVYDRLAHHYGRAGRLTEAVTYLGRLAEAARKRYAFDEAVRAIDAALAHLDQLPDDAADRQRVTLALGQAQLLSILGRFDAVARTLRALHDPVQRLNDPRLAAQYYFRLGLTSSYLSAHDEAERAARRALDEATRAGDAAARGQALYVLAIHGFSTGHALDGAAHGRQAVALLDATGERFWAGHAYWILGLNQYLLGEFDAALESANRVHALAVALGYQILEGFAAYTAAWVHVTRGDAKAAIEAAERGVARAPDLSTRSIAEGLLGYAYVENGDVARAISLLEPLVRKASRHEIRRSSTTLFLAEAFRRQGRMDRAREAAIAGIDAGHAVGFPWTVAWGERLLGRIALASGDLLAARARFDEALRIFRGIPAPFEIAVTGMDLAELAHRHGDTTAAGDHLRGARAEFRRLGAGAYERRAELLAAHDGLRAAG
jgi:DNA-binding SARP family transcriptional activator